MERFIHRQNIEHYERLLQRTTDEAERQRILKLLEEERKKLPDQPPARNSKKSERSLRINGRFAKGGEPKR